MFFTHGNCTDCGASLKLNAEGKAQVIDRYQKEQELCERAFRASKYMQVANSPESFQAYWDGWREAKGL